jgi:hypothetical protein
MGALVLNQMTETLPEIVSKGVFDGTHFDTSAGADT